MSRGPLDQLGVGDVNDEYGAEISAKSLLKRRCLQLKTKEFSEWTLLREWEVLEAPRQGLGAGPS